MRNTSAKKVLCSLLIAAFLTASVTAGVCLYPHSSESGNTPSIVSLDVCGHGHCAQAFAGADILAVPAHSSSHIPCFDKSFPPNPVEAVTPAAPGEIEKPPKA